VVVLITSICCHFKKNDKDKDRQKRKGLRGTSTQRMLCLETYGWTKIKRKG